MKQILIFIAVLISCNIVLYGQKKNSGKTDTLFKSSVLSGLNFRSIGPSFSSGRIADFAVNPNNYSEWYVASASGGISELTFKKRGFTGLCC